uniref:Leucine-rich repeat-containing N-terminal plant-type domain-containing protein n=1 Tax=Oryza punctata TaxID=4537 RepID=A0A0E0MMN3_ORYPU
MASPLASPASTGPPPPPRWPLALSRLLFRPSDASASPHPPCLLLNPAADPSPDPASVIAEDEGRAHAVQVPYHGGPVWGLGVVGWQRQQPLCLIDDAMRVVRRDMRGAHNALQGTVPPELGSLRCLRVLILDANNLTGSIPASLGNLTSLTELALTGNHLSGHIPSALGNLRASSAST